MPKVSVIIPVYGVEKYIERCARSLFEQTLDDIEYLFIDDCTPDRSIEVLKSILEEYPNRKEQVIIHRMEQNSGQAAVRKWGMLNATGDYVIHCDSDDWVDEDMYRAMYEKAVEGDYDLVACDYFESDGFNKLVKKEFVNTKQDLLFYDVLTRITGSMVWNKMVRRTIYSNQIDFPRYNMGEDHALLIQLALFCKTSARIDKPLYYYYQNTQSITKVPSREGIIKRFTHSIGNAETILRFMKAHNLDEKYSNELTRLLLHKKNLIRPLISEKEYYHLWINTFREINSKVLFNPCVTLAEKIKFILSYMKLYKNAN